MRRKTFLLVTIVSSVSLLMIGCGIPQEDYDAVVAERNAAQAKVTTLQTQIDSLQNELNEAEEQIESIESIENSLSKLEGELSAAQSQISSLQSALNNANTSLTAAEAKIADLEEIYRVVLFFDDFEDGDLLGWNLEGGWSGIQEEGNYSLRGTGICSADIGPKQWTDYSLEARIKFSQSARVNFRYTTDSKTYFLDILPEGAILYKQLTYSTVLAKSAMSLPENQWLDLRIIVKGAIIDCYIDNAMLFRYTDDEPLTDGTFSFQLPANSVLYLDDVIVMVAKLSSQIWK